MFAGGRRRSSNNIRAMQLFHELKQQFPTVPDYIVSAYISNYANKTNPSNKHTLQEVLDAGIGSEVGQQTEDLMGRNSTETIEPALTLLSTSSNNETSSSKEDVQKSDNEQKTTAATERSRHDEMDQSDSDINRNVVKPSALYTKNSDTVDVCASDINVAHKEGKSSFFVKRPDSLDIRNVIGDFNQSGSSGRQIQPSGRCSDIHKLLNCETVNNKPPRSPLSSSKRFGNQKNSPTKNEQIKSPIPSPDATKRLSNLEITNVKKTEQKRETADTPTQTTDTLLGSLYDFLMIFCMLINCINLNII